jgi:hypothetical protein
VRKLVALAGPDNHEDVEEDVDHIQIQIQRCKHVLLRAAINTSYIGLLKVYTELIYLYFNQSTA